MNYNPTKMEKEVRLYLGNLLEDKLPEATILHFADLHDSNPAYTGKHAHILWKTTLSCLNFLMATTTTAGNSAKFTRKEKVGGVEVTETQDNTSTSGSPIKAYQDLYKEYDGHPEKFGIIAVASSGASGGVSTGAVAISGTNRPNLYGINSPISNTRLSSIYNRR